MKNNDSNKMKPPYIPWETFKNFLKTLSSSATPDRIDSSMMPPTMSGFNKAGVTSALKFFGLIDSDGKTTSQLNELIKACETNNWAIKVKEILVPAYNNIIDNLKLDAATRRQLEEKFGASHQMNERFIRFFISLLRDADETISPFLTQRQKRRGRGSTKRVTKKKKNETGQDNGKGGSTYRPPESSTPEGMFDQPIPIVSDGSCYIRIPRNITINQVELVKAAVAFIEAMAKQNKETE